MAEPEEYTPAEQAAHLTAAIRGVVDVVTMGAIEALPSVPRPPDLHERAPALRAGELRVVVQGRFLVSAGGNTERPLPLRPARLHRVLAKDRYPQGRAAQLLYVSGRRGRGMMLLLLCAAGCALFGGWLLAGERRPGKKRTSTTR